MALGQLTDPSAVLAAMDEFDRIGRETFLARYGFGKSRKYLLVYNGKRYDSKAIAGAAHGYQHGVPLEWRDFNGGVSTASAATHLQRLGFEIETRH